MPGLNVHRANQSYPPRSTRLTAGKLRRQRTNGGGRSSATAPHVGRDRKTVRLYLSGKRQVGQRISGRPDSFGKYLAYCTLRLAEDPHLWGTALFDEVTAMGYDRSYPSFHRGPPPGPGGHRGCHPAPLFSLPQLDFVTAHPGGCRCHNDDRTAPERGADPGRTPSGTRVPTLTTPMALPQDTTRACPAGSARSVGPVCRSSG